MIYATVERDGNALIVAGSPIGTKYSIASLLVPIPKEAERMSLTDVSQHTFEHHAHEAIGEAGSLPEAIAIMDRYARRWMASPSPKKACDCEPIKPRPRRRRRGR